MMLFLSGFELMASHLCLLNKARYSNMRISLHYSSLTCFAILSAADLMSLGTILKADVAARSAQ